MAIDNEIIDDNNSFEKVVGKDRNIKLKLQPCAVSYKLGRDTFFCRFKTANKIAFQNGKI